MAGASFTPDILWEDPYFTEDSKRPLTRREAVLWIAKHIRREDNCVTKKGEIDASLRHLADKWNWAKTTVERFLKKCEKLGILVLKKCKINGTVQYVISYCFSTLSAFSTKMNGTASGTGVGQEWDKVKSRKSEEKKDSPYSPSEGDEDPMAGLEPQPQRAAGAGPSKPASGAGCTNPDPQPAESQQAAPDGAGPSQKIPRKRVSRAIDPNWCPKPETQAWARNGKIGATDTQIAEQLEEFIRHFEANGKPMKDWDKAFQNWMSRAKKWGQLDAPRKTWQERKLEEMSL